MRNIALHFTFYFTYTILINIKIQKMFLFNRILEYLPNNIITNMFVIFDGY